MVQFSRINANQAPIELLLEADPDEGMIHRYLEGAYCFVGHTNHKIIAACIVKPIDSATAEIFNISVHPEHQNKGIGSKLLNYVIKQISHENITRLVLGTGTFGHQLSYYQRAGFRVDSVIKDHFLKHYELPIFENGIQHKDMLRLYLDLLQNN